MQNRRYDFGNDHNYQKQSTRDQQQSSRNENLYPINQNHYPPPRQLSPSQPAQRQRHNSSDISGLENYLPSEPFISQNRSLRSESKLNSIPFENKNEGNQNRPPKSNIDYNKPKERRMLVEFEDDDDDKQSVCFYI